MKRSRKQLRGRSGKRLIPLEKRATRSSTTFNEHLSECLEEAGEEITRRPLDQSALDKAKRVVDEGLRIISERQKLIKIADRSEYGWGVVAEYHAGGRIGLRE